MGTWCRGVEAAQTPSAVSPGGPWASPSPAAAPSAQGRGRILLPALSAPSLLSQGLGALGAAPEATSPGPTGIGGGTDPGPQEHNAFTGLEREEEEGREG